MMLSLSLRFFFVACMLSTLFAGCAYNELTYFRKHGATVESERTDWGLCGGNFYSSGKVAPSLDENILKCMNQKGYSSLNDYYYEQSIDFVNRRLAVDSYIDTSLLERCGFDKLSSGPCSYEWFVRKSKISNTLQCMSDLGWEQYLPRYKASFKIIDDSKNIDRNFCLYQTPRNGKGGVSFGKWRWE